MISFGADTEEQVKAIYQAAKDNGGTCEGEPGPRGRDGEYYVAYFRDPDGNKFAAFLTQG
ncbi:MAG: VOC family protein [Emcibacteraceae bacterium]|nr:VOC family protein [Emcibacteraceae bacterium]